ncbi:MAG: MATE family efflux transporter [Chloroflexi bacterium]|nr:MATE family efflux transporter [Chloroflexota bacterium]
MNAAQVRTVERRALAPGEDRGTTSNPPNVAWVRVAALAGPAVVDGLLSMTVGVSGLLMVGRLGDSALAGMGAALQLIWFAISFGAALGTGTTVLIAHAIGRGDQVQARHTLVQATLAAVAVSCFITSLSPWTREAVALLGGDTEVTRQGAEYLHVTVVGAIVLVPSAVFGGALRGSGDTRTPMIAGLLTNVVNLLVSPALVFGIWGLPALGVAGAAWGATLGRGAGALLLLTILLEGRGVLALPFGRSAMSMWKFDSEEMKRIVRLSLPAAVEQGQSTMATLLFGVLVLSQGTSISAAQRVVFNLMGISYLPAIGCATAATILVGQAYGSGVPHPGGPAAITATNRAYMLSLAWLVASGGTFVLFSPALVALYTGVPEVIDSGIPGLRVIGIYLPISSVAIVFGSALRGSGNTRFPMIASALVMWLVTLPLAWVAGNVLHAGLTGMLFAFSVGGLLGGIVLFIRWRTIESSLRAS